MQDYIYMRYFVYSTSKRKKFDYFEFSKVSRNTLYKQQINDLNEEIKRQKDLEEAKVKEAVQTITIEFNNEKEKYEKIEDDLKNIKKEKEKADEDLLLAQNKILTLEKQIEERENKINFLKKENELTSEKYKEVLTTLNSQLYSAKEKEKKNNEILKNMNLNESQRLLVNKDPQELISYIVEKDNYCTTIENKNKDLTEKLSQLESSKEKIENELYDLKSKVLSLENKNSNLTKDNEELQKIIDDYKGQKSLLLSSIL